MQTIPHGPVSRRRVESDPINEGLKELIALGLIRWTCEHVSPDDWPNDLPLPVVFTEQGQAIRTEG